MSDKATPKQAPTRRIPSQARSLHKVGLMLEAAVQLLDEVDVAALTTNAVAARAGVSIGTLYQYFGDKRALLDALVAHELGAMSDRITRSLQAREVDAPGDRLRGVVRAVVGAYGGRGRAHRMLIEHALASGSGGRLSPLFERIVAALSADGVAIPGRARREVTPAQAFVLTHAVAGVLRALVASERTPPSREVEDALVALSVGFVDGARGPVRDGES